MNNMKGPYRGIAPHSNAYGDIDYHKNYTTPTDMTNFNQRRLENWLKPQVVGNQAFDDYIHSENRSTLAFSKDIPYVAENIQYIPDLGDTL